MLTSLNYSLRLEQEIDLWSINFSVLGGQVIAEINSSGAFTRGYVYLGGQLLAVQQNSQVSWVHQDPVTKSQRVTNSAGTVVSTIELDPWGGETNRSSNEAFQPKKFTSYERDSGGSDDAMHRRYNRWHSRFDQPDPYHGSYNAADPQSLNRYAYVQNDPVNFVDPTGLLAQMCGLFTTGSEGAQGLVCFGNAAPFNPFVPRDPIIPDPGDPQEPLPAKTPAPPVPCGVNPVTGEPGFTSDPINQTGHMRDDGDRGGHGYFGASRGRGTRPHTGIDIRGDLNATPIVAYLAGTASISNHPRGYGNMVTIDHGNGLTSRYSHLSHAIDQLGKPPIHSIAATSRIQPVKWVKAAAVKPVLTSPALSKSGNVSAGFRY